MMSVSVISVVMRNSGMNGECMMLMLIVFIVVVLVGGVSCLSDVIMNVENVKYMLVISLQLMVEFYSNVDVMNVIMVRCFICWLW